MKVVLSLLCIVLASRSVQAQQIVEWHNLKCGVNNQQMYDRFDNILIKTCNDYCRQSTLYKPSYQYQYGKCEIKDGYGNCKCVYEN